MRADVSGTDGRVWIRGLRQGRHELTAARAGRYRVIAEPGAEEVVIRIPVTGRVEGMVFGLRGKPAVSFRIAWRAVGESPAEDHLGLSMVRGRFVLTEVPVGVVTLVASTSDAVSAPIRVEVTPDRPVTGIRLHLERGAILECTVQRPDGGGIEGALLNLESRSPNLPTWTNLGITDEKGRCTVRGLPAGRMKVTVEAAGFARVERGVDVSSGGSADLSITLRK